MKSQKAESALMDKVVTMLFEFKEMKEEIKHLKKRIDDLETAKGIELLEELEKEQARGRFEKRLEQDDAW